MKDPLLHSDEITRRHFIANAARTYLGVGLMPVFAGAITGNALAKPTP